MSDASNIEKKLLPGQLGSQEEQISVNEADLAKYSDFEPTKPVSQQNQPSVREGLSSKQTDNTGTQQAEPCPTYHHSSSK